MPSRGRARSDFRRVVVVEDDPAMRLYIEAALQDLALDLGFCIDVAQALAVLAERPARLVITDLMLGPDSGLTLIERLRADPGAFGTPKVVVTGAALDATGVAKRLRQLGVWRSLSKPFALEAIEACVVDALRDPVAASPTCRPRPAGPVPAAGREPRPAVVETLFGGNLALYAAYREACLAQFRADIAEGDALAGRGDPAALRRLAHNLRSVLRMLGEEPVAAHADHLEATLEDARLRPQTGPSWQRLRAALLDTIDGA